MKKEIEKEEMKEEILTYINKERTVTVQDLARALKKETAQEFRELVKVLSKLECQKQVRFTDDGRVQLDTQKKEIRLQGTFHANKNGFGFVSLSPEEDDLFIGKNDVHHAVDGDVVEVVITKVADRMKETAAEARVVEIIEHGLKTAVGHLVIDEERPEYAGYIRSRNQKIDYPIYIEKSALVLDGTEVLKVQIEDYPNRKYPYFVGTVLDIIGHINDPGLDVLEVLESLDIVSIFPEEVLTEAEAISEKISEEELEGRLDLREEITFTIDGADAKDLDDAVHIKALANGNVELGVHIADVSYYVEENSALDKEALSRATSVYVTDRVVPMLPERLSNGICSLNPAVDRLTQSAIMEIDAKGQVVEYQIIQSVINTTYRMTYHDVNEILKGNTQKQEQFATIVPSIEQMAKLHHVLEAMRLRRGALNFDTSEAKILVNQEGRPVDIVLRQRGIAERMIESFMLVANETVAKHFAKEKLAFIYRIHEEPKAEKVQKFIDYAATFGIRVYGTASSIGQEALQDIMTAIKGEPYEAVLSTMLLRSMQQARYSEHNQGHYGLAADFYTHFTSPIRRYPDLLVHRLIREYSLSKEKTRYFEQLIPDIAAQSSRCERRAIEAERTVEAMKKAEYMQDFVGEEFEGLVSSVVKFGLFVELPNTIEGLIHVQQLPEFYRYNERNLTLQGEKSGVVFRIGQAIRVRVVAADKTTGEIDFEYIPSELDTIEKTGHSSLSRKTKTKKDKIKRKKGKPFYQEITTKGGKHGKRRRKSRRSK